MNISSITRIKETKNNRVIICPSGAMIHIAEVDAPATTYHVFQAEKNKGLKRKKRRPFPEELTKLL